jgi:hypothetical protein
MDIKRMVFRLDYFLSIIIGLSALILSIFLLLFDQNIILLLFSTSIILACLGWIVFNKRISVIRDSIILSDKKFYILIILSLLIFIICSLIMNLRIYNTTVPTVYYLLMSLISILVIYIVVFGNISRNHVFFILGLSILLGISLRWINIFLYPSIPGIDPWYHMSFTNSLIETGHLPVDTSYSTIPGFHLVVSSFELIMRISYIETSAIIISSLQVIVAVIFLYLIGKSLGFPRIGLIGGVVFGIAPYALKYGFWIIPNTLGAILWLPIIYFLIQLWTNEDNSNKIKYYILIILTMILLVVTHTISSMGLSLVLIVGFLSDKFMTWFSICDSPKKRKNLVPITIAITFLVIMFGWWTYISNDISNLAGLIKNGFDSGKELGFSKYSNINGLDEWVGSIARIANIILFISMAIVGYFFLISKKARCRGEFQYANMAAFPLIIVVVSLIGSYTIIGDRWLYFSEMLLAIAVAVCFFLILRLPKRTITKAISLMICFIFIFIMISSPIASIGNTGDFDKDNVRYAFNEAEMTSATYISDLNKSVVTDTLYSLVLNNKGVRDISYLNDNISIPEHSIPVLIAIRSELTTKNFQSSNGTGISNPLNVLVVGSGTIKFEKFYSNGQCDVYYG